MPNESNHEKKIPNTAIFIESILNDNNIHNKDPQTILFLLELINSILLNNIELSCDIFEKAQLFCNHRINYSPQFQKNNQKNVDNFINPNDIMLAIKALSEFGIMNQYPNDTLAEMANTVNSIPLPPITKLKSFYLPKEKFCSFNQNYVVQKVFIYLF